MGQFRLIKCSAPGWVKEFDTGADAAIELDYWICDDCRREYLCNNLDSMLASPCGLEFWFEDSIDDPPTIPEEIQDNYDKKESKPEWTKEYWT